MRVLDTTHQPLQKWSRICYRLFLSGLLSLFRSIRFGLPSLEEGFIATSPGNVSLYQVGHYRPPPDLTKFGKNSKTICNKIIQFVLYGLPSSPCFTLTTVGHAKTNAK